MHRQLDREGISVKMHLLVLPFFLLLSLTWCGRFGNGYSVNGFFDEPFMKEGYHLVVTVPCGSVSLNITQHRHSQNYLAIRLNNGRYLFNGNHQINKPREYEAAGTTFVYSLHQGPLDLHTDGFTATGPLTESIDIMLLYRGPNPGVIYRFVIPGSLEENKNLLYDTVFSKYQDLQKIRAEHVTTRNNVLSLPQLPRPHKNEKLVWRAIYRSNCSRSCAGGIQTIKYVCVNEYTPLQVPREKCDSLGKPHDHVSCNTDPCLPKWEGQKWSPCSVTCGSGIRTREVRCVQEVRPSFTVIIRDGACRGPKNLATRQICEMPACNETSSRLTAPQWNIGLWSPCSVTCGMGIRTRVVTCISNAICNVREQPASQEACDSGPCLTELIVTSAKLQKSQWLYTDWPNHCSAECGIGVQTRRIFCEASSYENRCDLYSRPDTSRECSSDRTCNAKWFTGPWSECSSNCDIGEQSRQVVCMVILHSQLIVGLEMYCPVNKPSSRRVCRERPCNATWFMSDWSQCSRSCGTGIQNRDVKCLNANGQLPESHELHCQEKDRPLSKRRCNDYPCKNNLQRSENSNKPIKIQNKPETLNDLEDPEDPLCKDKRPDCRRAAQARLCSYPFYKESCCLSCSLVKQDLA